MYYKKAKEPKIMKVFIFLLFIGSILLLTFHIGLMVGGEMKRQSGLCKHDFDIFEIALEISKQLK